MTSTEKRQTPHETLFFDDGNIILSAASKNEVESITLFRVHKSLLAFNSDVFRNMFELPGSCDELYNGVDVIAMPDSSEDITSLLNAIYNPTSIPFKKFDPNTPLLVVATLNMATKYEMTAVRERIVKHVEEDWPIDLAGWDIFEDNVLGLERYKPDALLDRIIPEPASAIMLARRFNIPRILPAAFYCLSMINAHHDWSNHVEPDSTDETSDDGSEDWPMDLGTKTARWSLLSAKDLLDLTRGIEVLKKKGTNLNIDYSESKTICGSSCPETFRDAVDDIKSEASEHDLIYALRNVDDDCLDCSHCQSRFSRKVKSLRESIWESLPRYFNLIGGWILLLPLLYKLTQIFKVGKFRNTVKEDNIRIRTTSTRLHVTLWLSDGNIILAAAAKELPNRVIMFRVHKSILALQSQIFADMFSLPSPDGSQDADDNYDGIPVVSMPDSAEEIECMLNVLYNPATLHFEKFFPNTPSQVEGILAMATKYEMREVRKRVVAHVEADWPHTLEEWDRFESRIKFLGDVNPECDVDKAIPEPAAAIMLARRFAIPQILPAAFYFLSIVNAQHDWDHHLVHEDSKWELLAADDDNHDTWPLLRTSMTARWGILGAQELRDLFVGKEHLARRAWTLTFVISSRCTTSEGCLKALNTLRQTVINDFLEPLGLLAVMHPNRVKKLAKKSYGVCSVCTTGAVSRVAELRREIWDALPRYFNLTGK
ncbi:hypothetical protein DFH11DRAFT_1743985 [Phellopilus nigrolimitatus]|nr:hypothetical protein DFH11DRAFT_1743985 [Phellopilus nigrolimitatus]